MTIYFDAEDKRYRLPLLAQELAAYKATIRITATRLVDGTRGKKVLLVEISDDIDRSGLDEIVEAHDETKPAEPTKDEASVKVLLALAKGKKPDDADMAILEKAI